MLNSALLNGVYYNTGENDMLIPIAYTGQDNHGITVGIIIIVIIIFLFLRYLYKRGKNASPATEQEYREHEQIRKEKWKKTGQAVKWKWKKKKWAKLQKGDSQAKASSVIGRPDSIQKEEKDTGQETWIYDFGSEGKRIITFNDGFIEKIEVKY